MKKNLITCILAIAALSLYSQVTPIWSANCGGSSMDIFYNGCYGSEGRYAFIGQSASANHDLTVNYGNSDVWLFIKNEDGSTFLSKSFNGSSDDYGIDIVQRSDSMYVFLINTKSSGTSDFSSNFGGMDFWLKSMTHDSIFSPGLHFGGLGDDYANDLGLTIDEGYIIVGTSNSSDTIFNGNQGLKDGFYIRISPAGIPLWAHTYGSAFDDRIQKVTCLPDGNFMTAGYTEVPGGCYLQILKINSTGSVTDHHEFNGDSTIYPLALTHMSNNMIFAGGYTSATQMDFFNNSDPDAGFVIRFNSATDPDTMVFFSGNGMEAVTDIVKYNDSLLLVTVVSTSSSGTFAGNHGSSDIYIAVMDTDLNIKGIYPFGGSMMDGVFEFCQTASFLNPLNEMVMASCSESANGHLPGNYGMLDGWILRFDPADILAGISETNTENIMIYPNPVSDAVHVMLPEIKECTINLLSLDGRIIRSWDKCGIVNRLNLDGYNRGVYMLEIRYASGSINKMLVKQ